MRHATSDMNENMRGMRAIHSKRNEESKIIEQNAETKFQAYRRIIFDENFQSNWQIASCTNLLFINGFYPESIDYFVFDFVVKI